MPATLSKLLASTQFAPTPIGAVHVKRVSLLQRLQRAKQCKLAVVTAGAGYGKTTLLDQWSQERLVTGAQVAWLTLPREEKGFGEFCDALFLALRHCGISLEWAVVPNEISAATVDDIVAILVGGIVELPRDVCIVLDDYQHASDEWTHRLIQKLLDYCPSNLHLVISSRVTPPLRLSRLRMQDQVIELSSSELPFSPAEIRSFLDENLGVGRFTADEFELIHEMTGGWPSCVQQATSLLKHRPEGRVRLRELVWLSDDMGAYLSEEVLSRLSPELVMFAESLSIFRRFNADMAEVVTDSPQSSDWLRRMEAENLLILRVESSDRTPWYRFHRVFGDFLASRLALRGKDHVAGLHRRGSRWLADHGLLPEAVSHASLGGDMSCAADLILTTAPDSWTLDYVGPTLQLLDQLPEETLFRQQRLFVLACLTLILSSRDGRILRWLAKLDATKPQPDPDLDGMVPLVHAAFALQQDDTQHIIELLEPLRGATTKNPFLRHVLVSALVTAYAAAGRFNDAKRLLDSHPIPKGDRDNDLALVIDVKRIQCMMLAGEISEAERIGTPLLIAAQAHGKRSICANLYAGILADAYYELDRIEDARGTIANRSGLLHDSSPDVIVRASLCRARLDLLQKGPDIALLFLQEQGAHLRSLEQHRAVAYMLAEQVKLHLSLGNHSRAAELSASLVELSDLHAEDQGFLAEIPVIGAIAQAHLLLDSEPEGALRALNHARNRLEALHRGRDLAHVDLLCAVASEALSRPDEALVYAVRAVEAGSRLGLRRTFIDEGIASARLLSRLAREKHGSKALLNYVKDLLLAFPNKITSELMSNAQSNGTLTPREREILELVSQAMSNKRIAQKLNITTETVKWNLRNIFSKLGVSSRYHAITWAREQALIS